MSKTPKLTCVAAVAGAHGVHGNLKVKSFTDDPLAFASYGPLLDETGAHLFTPKNARPVGRFYSLSVKEKMTREQVEAFKSTKLYVPRDALPEVDEDEFYHSDLIGMTVTSDGAVLGTVADVHNFGAGDTLEIRPPSGPTFFHPFTQAAVPEIDMKARTLVAVIEDAIEARGDGAPKLPDEDDAPEG